MQTENSSRSAKNNILAKLKKQVGKVNYDNLPVEPDYIYPEYSHQQLVVQLVTHLEANHSQVIKVTSAEIPTTVEKQLKLRNIDRLLYGENGKYSSILERHFCKNKEEKIYLEKYNFLLTDNKEKLFNDSPAAITSSYCSIASTGSIVLWPTPEEPRTLSLIPPLHIVIVDLKKLYCDFATLINEQQWQDKLPTNVLLISGPSKTADIQQTLAFGAHGPKELLVLLIEED